jgi:magnesium transporter
MGRVVLKEFTIGLILGLFYGLLVGLAAHFRYSMMALGISVGLAVVSSMAVATLVGSLVPMVLGKLNIDPAVATGPFVTTAIDIMSIFLYFSFAKFLFDLS